MLWFALGFLAGAGASMLFLGYLAVVVEDEERKEMAREQREKDKKNLREVEDWYRNYY